MKKLLALLLAVVLVCSMFVACNKNKGKDPSVTYDLESAASYLEGLYEDSLSITSVDYTVVAQVMIGGVAYKIDWSVDTDAVKVGAPENNFVTIDVNEKSTEELAYKLTATIKAGDGTSTTVTFDLTVPKYEVNSHADYMAAKQDDVLTVEGIVVAINSKDAGNKYNHLFLADASVTGGYYCYSITQDPVKDLGIQVGMTVKVTGAMAPYSGMQEIKNGQVAIVDSTIKEVAPVDLTAAFTAGDNLAAYVGLPVVIKGVTLGTQELATATSQYLFFNIGEQKGYVRTYVTDFPTTLKAGDKSTIDADHAAHFGYEADVTGILILYNSAPYLIPMSVAPFTNYQEIIRTPEEKVDTELNELKLESSVTSDKVIDLIAKGKYYEDVTLTWALDEATDVASIADGKLTLVVPDEEATVSITVTATCENVTKTKTFTIKLSKAVTSVAELLEIGAAQESYTTEKYIAGGVITEIQNETYGNIVIQDESGESILVYGTFIDGKKYGEAEGAKPVVGDYVVVVGVVGQYNGTPQMKNADITDFSTPTAIKDASDAGAAQEHNTYTTDKYLVTGKVTEIVNTQYGNLYIQDAEGNTIYIYGLYTQGGARFDAMDPQPAVGDVIYVISTAGQYNDTPQLKNATLVCITSGEGAEGGEGEGSGSVEDGTPHVEVSLTEAANLEDGTKVVLKGTVSEVNTSWNDQYGNMSVTIADETGATFYLYRISTKVKVGDYISVTGVIASYNGAKQTAQGATAIVLEAAPEAPIPEGTVEATLKEAASLPDGTKVILKGTVIEINTAWSEQYGNITVTIADAAGDTFYIYRLSTNVSVGDVVTITGVIGSYNGSKQVAQGATAVIEANNQGGSGSGSGDSGSSAGTTSLKDAANLEDGTEVVISGTVCLINTSWNEQYGNISVTIEDAEGYTFYIYRLATKVKVGDVITVTGVIASHGDTKEIAAGATAVIDYAAPEEVIPEGTVEVSLKEAHDLPDGTKVILKGTVQEINTEWSDQYGNITVTIVDEAGDTFYIYRLKTNVSVGDKVTITGEIGTYKGAKQVAAGATAVIG